MVPALAVCFLILAPAGRPYAVAADVNAGEDAVILEESLDIEIVSASQARLHYRNRTQVLTPRGVDRFDTASVFYNPWIEIRNLHGAVTSPDGKRSEVKKQQIAESSYTSYALYDEDRLRSLLFQGVVPGSIVEHEYEESLSSLFFLPDWFDLQETIPSRSKTLTVRASASFPIRFDVRGAAPEYTREEKDGTVTHRWQVRDVPPLKGEPFMPPGGDVVPRILIAPKEIGWDQHTIDASSWSGIAAWDWSLVKDRIQPNADVTQTARELTAGVNDPEEKIRRLYDFVRLKINYVAIYLGIGGWQPHPSGDILRARYGDCKDKAALLIALLQSVGLRGLPALIMTRDTRLIDRDIPLVAFNHQIVAIPQEDGGYFFLDPTWDQNIPYGELPWVDQGVPILVVRDDGRGELLQTPLSPPEKNRRHIVATAQLKPTGDLEGTYQIQAWGGRRGLMKDLLAAKSSERETALADLMGWLCPGAVLQGQDVNVPTDPKSPATATIRFMVPRFIMRAGAKEIISPYLVRFKGLTDAAAYPKRRYTVLFQDLRSDTSETRLQLPPGRTLKKIPENRTLDGPGISATTTFELTKEQDHEILVVKRTVTISRREIPVEDYPALRTFVAALSEQEAGAVTLESEAIASALLQPDGP